LTLQLKGKEGPGRNLRPASEGIDLNLERRKLVSVIKKLAIVLAAALILASSAESALADTIVIQPDGVGGKDTFVHKAESEGSFGSAEDLRLGVRSNTDDEHRVLIQFDLGDIPLGSQVNSADLSLYHFTEENGYYYLTLDALRVSEAWSEAAATWNNQPSLDPLVQSSNFFDRYHSTPDWHQWDLTDLTQFWVDGVYENNGVALIVGELSQGYSLKVCQSSESSQDPSLRPKLVVNYTPPDPSAMLDSMTALVATSLGNGSIDDDEIAESLWEKLGAASEKLVEGKEGTAENILGAFMNSVQAQWGKHIDGEVADSLVNNAEYVASILGSSED
jgi:hypothetical protein